VRCLRARLERVEAAVEAQRARQEGDLGACVHASSVTPQITQVTERGVQSWRGAASVRPRSGVRRVDVPDHLRAGRGLTQPARRFLTRFGGRANCAKAVEVAAVACAYQGEYITANVTLFPVVPMTCTVCGNMPVFNATVLRIVQPSRGYQSPR